MDRRKFLKGMAASSVAAPTLAWAAPGAPAAGELERRELGRTGARISVLGFGGLLLNRQTAADAANWVAWAFDQTCNYYDVAPAYGNAQERMGPALKPYRDRVFLSCKTKARDGAGVRKELEESLRLLQTDHFDLYQLHCLFTADEVKQATAPGGAIEEILKARQAGKIKHIGFSAHTEEGALAALNAFDFDTVMFPLNFASWIKAGFGPAVHKLAREKKMGILALKGMCHQGWTKDAPQRAASVYKRNWYEPLDTPDEIALGLRFSLGLPVTAVLSPGFFDLFKIGVECARRGLPPLSEQENEALKKLAMASTPLFPRAN